MLSSKKSRSRCCHALAGGFRHVAIARQQRAIDAGDPAKSRQGSGDLLGKSQRQGVQLVAIQDARRGRTASRTPSVSSRSRRSLVGAVGRVACVRRAPPSRRKEPGLHLPGWRCTGRTPALPRRDRPGPRGRRSTPAMHPREQGQYTAIARPHRSWRWSRTARPARPQPPIVHVASGADARPPANDRTRDQAR